MAKSGKSAAAATVGRPKGVSVGRSGPGNFTFTTNKTGSGAAGAAVAPGFRPAMPKKVGRKKK
jgi:hypothetical protein